MKKTAVLLVNLGSPDNPYPGAVYRYLTQFLNDPRVIDINPIGRAVLVNGIIVPFRHRKSSKIYQELWTDNGSPLVHYGRLNQAQLQSRFNEMECRVFLAMRYQNPSLDTVLKEVQEWGPEKVVVIPMFPQYASASTGSVIQRVMELMKDWWTFPEMKIISQFHDHPKFLHAWHARAAAFDWKDYDHVLFSYHGLPERQVDKVYKDNKCRNHSCEHEINDENKLCYKATCYATTRSIVQSMNIPEGHYSVGFQSRLGKGWIEPFSDHVIEDLAKKGAKKILVFSPAFVADCLETTIEIGDEYQELFEEHGGEKVQLVPSLNDSKEWIDCLEALVRE